MLPQNVLSTDTIPAAFTPPRDIPKTALEDFELGGVAVGDASQGLAVKTWRAFIDSGTFIKLEAFDVSAQVVIADTDITEVSLAFDQLMQPCLAYVAAGQAKLYWWDSEAIQFQTTNLPVGAITPRVCLDDKRTSQSQANDVILAYVKTGKLYVRNQRDRFDTDYELSDVGGAVLVQIGMNLVGRFQFRIQP